MDLASDIEWTMNARATAENMKKRPLAQVGEDILFIATSINLEWSFRSKVGFCLKAQRQNILYFHRT